MAIKRIGILPDIDDDNAPHLHKAAVIVTRSAHDMHRYGRAVAGHLSQDVRHASIPDVAACVVWGADEAKVAGAVKRNAHATMIIVLPKRHKKDGPLEAAMKRVAAGGSRVEVVVVSAKAKASAWDVGEERYCEKVKDIRKPPQQQHAPSIPEKYRKRPIAPGPQAPSMRRQK